MEKRAIIKYLKDSHVEKGFDLFCNSRGLNYGHCVKFVYKEEGFHSVVLIIRAVSKSNGLFCKAVIPSTVSAEANLNEHLARILRGLLPYLGD